MYVYSLYMLHACFKIRYATAHTCIKSINIRRSRENFCGHAQCERSGGILTEKKIMTYSLDCCKKPVYTCRKKYIYSKTSRRELKVTHMNWICIRMYIYINIIYRKLTHWFYDYILHNIFYYGLINILYCFGFNHISYVLACLHIIYSIYSNI